MALQESLARFNKQQEKCQSTLTSLAARAGFSKCTTSHKAAPSNTVPVPVSVPARAPTLAVKFSENAARLQLIHSIRQSPVGAQIKRVIDLLHERREAFTSEQINEVCYVDVKANKAVFESLRKNLKVHYDGNHFSYKAKHDLKDKDQLLVLIRKFPEGISVTDLKDAYHTVLQDLQALKAVGQVWLLSNSDLKEEIAYPNDPRAPIKVDDDLKQLFRAIELPQDMLDIEKGLQVNRMKPATNTAQRRTMAEVHFINSKSKTNKKPRKISKRTKLTNAHLPELFKDLKSP